MNAKGLTQLNPSKKVLRSKTENGEAEVFVLPPDLLQKLGIHLGGVPTFSESSTDTRPSGFTNKSDIRKTDETILETAELMKTSVFLSPTFISTVSNIPGEVEIASIGDEKEETNTGIVQEIELTDTKVIKLEIENTDPILVNINENISNIMPCEKNHDTKNGENFVYDETSNTNTLPFSDINNLSHKRDIKIPTSNEYFDTIENSSLRICNPNESMSNNTEKSSIETSIQQNQEKDATILKSNHIEINHTHENTSKPSNSKNTPFDTYSTNINENNLNISLKSLTNSLIKKNHKAPIKIRIISEEILDASKLREFKALNSPNRATLTPVTIKTVINGRKKNENNCIENIDGSYLKAKVDEEVENLKEIKSTFLSKDSLKSQLPMNINLSDMNNDPQTNSSSNIISLIENKETFTSDSKNKNNEKETFPNFNSRLDGIKILNDNLNFSYKTQTLDNVDEDKNLNNRCVNTFDITSNNQKTNKSIELEYTSTAINMECVNYQNSRDSDTNNQNLQNTLKSACTPSIDATQYKSQYCESAKDVNTESKVFLNNVHIGSCKDSEINHHFTEFIDNDIENDKVVKKIFAPIIMKEQATIPDISSINSKSCIQGVEKPGGDQSDINFYYDIPKVSNTYKNRNKLQQPLRVTSVCLDSKDLLEIPEFIEQNLNNIISTDSSQNQEFCICGDFGKLDYYENDSLYQHIHFWKSNVSSKSSDLIYSNGQDNIKYYDTLEEKQSNDSCVSHVNYSNICWNNYEIDLQEPKTKLDFNTDNVDTSKYCVTNTTIKEFENFELNHGIVGVHKEDDERNINYKRSKDFPEKELRNNKLSEPIHIMGEKHSGKCNENQKTHKKLDIDCSENLVVPSPDEQRNLANPENDAKISECNIEDIESTINKTVKCGICMKLLSEIKWEDHISNVHCYIAWKVGDTIELDDTELINKLSQKLNCEGVLECTFCERKFKDVKLLISHIKVCMESLKSNTNSSIITDYTKCGVCQNQVETKKWISHIAEEHNYMAWNDLECTLDLQNQEKVEEHLDKINQQCNGLICSKCKVIYKHVNSYMKHIKKCDGTEDLMRNTSINDTSILNTSFETNVKKGRFRNKKKTDNVVFQSELENEKINMNKEIKTLEKDSSVIVKIPFIKSTIKEVHDQEALHKKKSIESHAGSEVANNNEKANRTFQNTEVNSENDDCLVEIEISQIVASSVSNVDSNTKTKRLNTEKKSKSALKTTNENTEGITYKGECKSGPNTNKCMTNNKEESIKNCDEIKVENKINTEKRQPSQMSGVDNRRNSYIDVIETPKNKTNKLNKGLSVKKYKQKTECISEASILVSHENVKHTISTEKKKKVLKASKLSNETITQNVKCGVCLQDIAFSSWFDHLSKEHNYLAWEDGTPPVDLNEEYEVEQHLKTVLKEYGELICMKCGCKRKYVKPYMNHVKSCETLPNDDSELNDSTVDNNINETNTNLNNTCLNESSDERDIICGVCHQEMKSRDWLDHIQKSHNYVAWIEGEKALDINDAEEVQRHLMSICKKIGGLTCSKCGLVRKYLKAFLQHVRSCKHTNTDTDDGDSSLIKNEAAFVQCGVCSEEMECNKWKYHAMSKHHNESWIVGDPPINTEVNRKNDDILSEIGHSSIIASSVPNANSTPSTRLQKTNTKNNSKSALKKIKETRDGIIVKEGRGKSGLNANQCTTNKEVPNKNCDATEGETIIKTEKGQPCHMSNEDTSRSSNFTVIETPENKTNKPSKRKSECISEAPNEDVGDSTPTEKKKKLFNESTLSKETMASAVTTQNVKCGVCLQDIVSSSWFDHMSKEHNYLAWQDGISPIDLSNEYEVEQHLRKMLKEYGELFCMKCGCKRKYVKPYMHHIKSCETLPNDDSELNDSTVDNNINESNTNLNNTSLNESSDERDIICGVCHQEMKSRDWLDHIQKSHDYVAWIEGEKALDINDAEEVQKHLMSICKRIGGLTCSKCGLVRKYLKAYLQHVRSCGHTNTDTDDSDTPLVKYEGGLVQCGVCSEEMEYNKWRHHAMSKHYNVAWIVGDPPIDLKNFYAVDKYLKEYKKKYNKLVCKVCSINRVSCHGFYAHILFCGKTEEETEKFKELCEICNNKYICIYKNQHTAMHREQEYAKKRKLKLAEEKDKEKGQSETSVTETPGRRRAAEKAKIVMAKYKANFNEGNTCKKCGFEANDEEELTQHNCSGARDDCASDSDKSVKLEQYSDDESVDTDVDSNVSNDEEVHVEKKKKKHYDSSPKVPRIPYSVKHVDSYLRKSYEDFCQMHLTSDTLFPKWRSSDYELISHEEISNYMPPLKESCKIKFISDEWNSYSMFQASSKRENHIAFVGGTIQCIAWAPSRVDDVEDICGNYLAVGCHSDSDCPRYNCDEIVQHSNLIQIWDFGNMAAPVAKFVFGIAHDYGTVWAMDWCPSGARDLPTVKTGDSELDKFKRLGLLAIACSNGSAYIFSVPYPSAEIQKEKPFYRMKPVAELRLSMSGDKRKCQATSLSWSSQKGHSIIIVGYSDGMVAFYDLTSDSPVLMRTENDVTIIHPYHDERSHNTCVTGVGTYAGGTDLGSGSAWSSSSGSGARAITGLPGRTAFVHTHLASTGATFTPHWPSVQLTGDSYISSLNQTVNELEWVGGGRRVGGVRSWCACARCGLSAATSQPLIRVLHAHPAYVEIKKRILGLLAMSPIGQKRKQGNDELAIKLEPFDYDDAVKKYGLEFKLISGKNKAAQQKASMMPSTAYPERYPLADVTSMAFCSSAKWHNKLAIGTHAGVILFVDVV